MNKTQTLKELTNIKKIIQDDINNGYRDIGYCADEDADIDNNLDLITYTIQLSRKSKENYIRQNVYMTTQQTIKLR